MANGMKVIMNIDSIRVDGCEPYDTVQEWLDNKGRASVLETCHDHAVEVIGAYMNGDVEYFYDSDDRGLAHYIPEAWKLGAEDPQSVIDEAEQWDPSIRHAFAQAMQKFFDAMKGSGCDTVEEFIQKMENDVKFQPSTNAFDTAIYNLKQALTTYEGSFDYGSYRAVIDESDTDALSTMLYGCLDDIKEHPENWALIDVIYK